LQLELQRGRQQKNQPKKDFLVPYDLDVMDRDYRLDHNRPSTRTPTQRQDTEAAFDAERADAVRHAVKTADDHARRAAVSQEAV
jgi:hypothetical protein